MKLGRSQKKFLKKNLKRLPLPEISQKLGLPEEEIKKHLKSIWSKEKYQKFFSGEKKEKIQSPSLVPFVFLAFLVVAIYLNSFGNEFVSDDIAAIYENKYIGNFPYMLRRFPLNFLRYLFYALVYHIAGLQPAVFRLLGILFHLGSVLVIYKLILLLYSSLLALIVASLFAVHPILSEAVIWISGSTHSQYTFFVLLSFFLYFLAKQKDWQKKYYLASIVSFLLALLTTEKAAILPLILFAFEAFLGNLKQAWKRLIPYFLLSSIWIVAIFSGGFLGGRVIDLQTQHYQKGGFYNPLIQIPTAIASYLQLIFWPDKLTLYHSEMTYTSAQFSLMAFMTLVFFGLTIFTFIKKKYRPYSFWLSFFVISLLPMLTPFKVAWIVAERYTYLGALGIFVIIGFGIQKIGQKAGDKKISYVILVIILTTLSIRTIKRNTDWKNQDTLWLAADKTSPSSPQNHNNLGDLYGRQGDFEKAVEEFKKAIALKPGYADAYHNLGNTYHQMGQDDLALENFQKALEFNSNLWQSHQNLAAIYFEQNQLDLAEQHLQKAIAINPENANLYLNLGILYRRLNEEAKARQTFQKVLELEPENQPAKQFLDQP